MKETRYMIFFTLMAGIFALFFRTAPPAHAQNGPIVSLGSNPVFNHYEDGWSRFNSNNTGHVVSLNIPTDQDLIITKFFIQDSNSYSDQGTYCVVEVDGTQIPYMAISKLRVNGNTQVKVVGTSSNHCGSSVSNYNKIYIEGYLTHQ